MPKRSRALLTDHDRDVYHGTVDADDSVYYEKNSRIRKRIDEELPPDLEILHQNEPSIYFDVLDVVLESALNEDVLEEAPDRIDNRLDELCELRRDED